MNQNTNQEEVISTKDLILKFINIFKIITGNWRVILIASGLGALISLGFDAKSYQKPVYTASTTFSLESGSAGGGGNEMANLASAFGVGGMPQARPADLFSGENFWQLLQTRLVIEKALMTPININGNAYLMANYYIEKSGIIQDWDGNLLQKPNVKFQKYRFKQKNPLNFTKFENEVMTSIYEKISKQTETGQIGTSSLAFIAANTQHELLSKVWAETLLATIYEFYKELKTKKTQMMLTISERRADSLKTLLYRNEQSLATYSNQNIGMVMAEGQMQQQRMARNTGQFSNLYAQTILQIDQLKTLLINQTPLYTIIEPIRLPLEKTAYGYGSNLGLGAVFGAVLSIIFMVLRKTYLSIASQI